MMRLIIGSVGSSPLTRGTHLPGLKQKDKDRFIPAYAGNSGRPMSPLEANTVHPRLRGELLKTKVGTPAITGSSPLTRGTQPIAVRLNFPLRFIPAYAGNSGVLSLESVTITVHPRLRGELFGATKEVFWPCGSSPLTRGTQSSALNSILIERFIPAYAGNSSLWTKSFLAILVHPRLRGEL